MTQSGTIRLQRCYLTPRDAVLNSNKWISYLTTILLNLWEVWNTLEWYYIISWVLHFMLIISARKLKCNFGLLKNRRKFISLVQENSLHHDKPIHYQYCSSLLVSCTKADINRLQILRNKCFRTILRCWIDTSVELMRKELGCLTMSQQVFSQDENSNYL